MAVRIRLKRTGAKNNACFRIVVIDGRSQRDGRTIEEVGFYDPRHTSENVKMERIQYWLDRGAQPSETVKDIIHRAQSGKTLLAPEPKKSKKALEKEKAAAAAKAEAEKAGKEEAVPAEAEEAK